MGKLEKTASTRSNDFEIVGGHSVVDGQEMVTHFRTTKGGFLVHTYLYLSIPGQHIRMTAMGTFENPGNIEKACSKEALSKIMALFQKGTIVLEDLGKVNDVLRKIEAIIKDE